MSNVIALCVGFCGVVLFTHLLRTGALGSVVYPTLITVTALTALAIALSERLQVLDLKNLTLGLQQIQQVRADIYAKADSVRRMGEELAELVVFNARSVGRFTGSGGELDRQLIAARDQIVQVLRDIGSDQKRIDDTVKPLNDVVLFDLKHEIINYLNDRYNRRLHLEPGVKLAPWQPVEAEFIALIQSPDFNRPLIVERTKHYGLYDSGLEPILDRIEKFMRDKTL